MKQEIFATHLKRYGCECILSLDGHAIYWNNGLRQSVPTEAEISDALARKICAGLEVNLPHEHRPKLPGPEDRNWTFDEAVERLKQQHYSPIYKLKYQVGEDWVFQVSEDREKYTEGENGEDLKKPFYWIPAGFGGYENLQKECCAPPWISSRKEKKRFCEEYWRETQWPDHGELADDPIRYINDQLSAIQCVRTLKGSLLVPEKHRIRLQEKLQDLSVLGAEYLAESASLALGKYEEPQWHVSKENLLKDERINDDANNDLIRILELAYRAGRVSERLSSFYRGVPQRAQDGFKLLDSQMKEGPRKDFTQEVHQIYRSNPDATKEQVAVKMKELGLIDWLAADGTYCQFKDAQTFYFYDNDKTEDKERVPFLESLGRIRRKIPR